MARRKDHTPDELRALIVQAARALVAQKGGAALTARALAARIGYAPGTIYNLFPDMDAVLLAVHGATLAGLQDELAAAVAATPADFSRIQALAQAYCAFAERHAPLWLAMFATPHRGRLPRWYRARLQSLFSLLEAELHACLKLGPAESRRTTRLLWAALHGITMLTLDGRLQAIGKSEARALVEALLAPYRPHG